VLIIYGFQVTPLHEALKENKGSCVGLNIIEQNWPKISLVIANVVLRGGTKINVDLRNLPYKKSEVKCTHPPCYKQIRTWWYQTHWHGLVNANAKWEF